MAKCERPCWTICFFFIWALVVPGVLLTHISVGLLIPPISDLPANIATGFDVVFRFAYMEKDAKAIKATSAGVLKLCTVTNPATTCKSSSLFPSQILASQRTTVNTATQKQAIIRDFGNSLGTVKKIANDKYFGTAELQDTAKSLDKMVAKMNEIKPIMKCYVAVPVFCGIYESGDKIVSGMSVVTQALAKFKTSDMVKQWDDNKGYLTGMHALPWILVIGLVFFSIFWLKGGVCCCCRGGTCTGLLLIFYALLWLVSFIFYLVIGVAGLSIRYASDKINVSALKGNPTLEAAINHIKVNYSAFWNVVFADLEEGLSLLLDSAMFFTIAALLIMFYSLLLCCCCPYRKKMEASAPPPAPAPEPAPAPTPAAEEPQFESI